MLSKHSREIINGYNRNLTQLKFTFSVARSFVRQIKLVDKKYKINNLTYVSQ